MLRILLDLQFVPNIKQIAEQYACVGWPFITDSTPCSFLYHLNVIYIYGAHSLENWAEHKPGRCIIDQLMAV